jgi:hypothetical protein
MSEGGPRSYKITTYMQLGATHAQAFRGGGWRSPWLADSGGMKYFLHSIPNIVL